MKIKNTIKMVCITTIIMNIMENTSVALNQINSGYTLIYRSIIISFLIGFIIWGIYDYHKHMKFIKHEIKKSIERSNQQLFYNLKSSTTLNDEQVLKIMKTLNANSQYTNDK